MCITLSRCSKQSFLKSSWRNAEAYILKQFLEEFLKEPLEKFKKPRKKLLCYNKDDDSEVKCIRISRDGNTCSSSIRMYVGIAQCASKGISTGCFEEISNGSEEGIDPGRNF